jgi:hypothetical protein
MGDVLEFPTPKAQGMAFLESQLRDILSRKGADEQLIAFAVEQLVRVYGRINESEQYSFSVHLPDGLSEAEKDTLHDEINAGLETVRSNNHALLLELVAQLVLAEVKLFQHERSP